MTGFGYPCAGCPASILDEDADYCEPLCEAKHIIRKARRRRTLTRVFSAPRAVLRWLGYLPTPLPDPKDS